MTLNDCFETVLVKKELGSVKSQILASSYLSFLTKSVKATFKGRSARAYWLKLQMFMAGLRHKDAVKQILAAPPDGSLHDVLRKRLQVMGLLIWPYQCASWDAATRLERFQAHYREIDQLGAPLDFSLDEQIVLASIEDLFPGLRVVLHQPIWLMREGGTTISLFTGDTLVFSLAFSLFRDADGARCAMIGGCQGRNIDGILDTYRSMTKALHGLRPRDFLLEAFGILCRIIDVKQVYAVSDAQRHRRHPFFNQTGDFPQDYDIAWQERSAVLNKDGLYEFPQVPARRSLDEIKAKKRSLYRKRYSFLDELEARVIKDYPSLKPIKFKEL